MIKVITKFSNKIKVNTFFLIWIILKKIKINTNGSSSRIRANRRVGESSITTRSWRKTTTMVLHVGVWRLHLFVFSFSGQQILWLCKRRRYVLFFLLPPSQLECIYICHLFFPTTFKRASFCNRKGHPSSSLKVWILPSLGYGAGLTQALRFLLRELWDESTVSVLSGSLLFIKYFV